jgi:hypothetical protein
MKMKFLLLFGGLLASIQATTGQETAPTATASAAAPALERGFAGKVIETTNTAGYTYVRVDTGAQKLWAAATQFAVKAGDNVTVGSGVPMTGYHSKTLNRDFDVVYFTGRIAVAGAEPAAGGAPVLPAGHPPIGGGAMPGLPPGHPSLTTAAAAKSLDLTGIKKAEGGKTVKEIYAAKVGLAGKNVSVRGKVVKFNAMILGKNWLHIQDGSGSADKLDNDITITTAASAAVGATVLVTGNVSTNRDFGAGYKYSVIIEDAKVTVE